MQFIRVDDRNTELLESFVQRAGASLKTFRYFSCRPFSIVRNHACTWVIEDGGQTQAYGHLDRDGDIVWLGIAVVAEARGKGLGRLMMGQLMDSAKALGIPVLRLSVDNENSVAIRLYESAGFGLVEKHERHSFYEWKHGPTDGATPDLGTLQSHSLSGE